MQSRLHKASFKACAAKCVPHRYEHSWLIILRVRVFRSNIGVVDGLLKICEIMAFLREPIELLTFSSALLLLLLTSSRAFEGCMQTSIREEENK